MKIKSLLTLSVLVSLSSMAATPKLAVSVLSDPAMLRMAGLPIWREDTEVNVAYSLLNESQMERLSIMAHSLHRCAGYEVLSDVSPSDKDAIDQIFADLRNRKERDRTFGFLAGDLPQSPDSKVAAAVAQVSPAGIKKWVEWFSAFPSRFNHGERANDAITNLKGSLEELARQYSYPITVEFISHQSTAQKSLRFSIQGSIHPEQVIVLGAHADSVNWQDGSSARAPGADDNASGSSDLLEALRILLAQGQPERSVHFFWYAGEESGLLGSAEIARTYKSQNVDVVAALQLDMTMMPGSGVGTITSIRDFTSPWLHDYMMKLNEFYVHARIEDDECGYACSDHASWNRRGYHAVFPFESQSRVMNQNLHTARDVIDSSSNFEHSALFAKIAVAFAMHLANSQDRGP
jgi:leucyl aminopeptidase